MKFPEQFRFTDAAPVPIKCPGCGEMREELVVMLREELGGGSYRDYFACALCSNHPEPMDEADILRIGYWAGFHACKQQFNKAFDQVDVDK